MCFMIAVVPSADSQPASATPSLLAEAPVEIAFGRDAPSYRLERCKGNLLVARRHSEARRQVVHYALFREEATFLDWCAAGPPVGSRRMEVSCRRGLQERDH